MKRHKPTVIEKIGKGSQKRERGVCDQCGHNISRNYDHGYGWSMWWSASTATECKGDTK